MSRLSFKTFCIELYAKHTNRDSTDVYSTFKKSGLIDIMQGIMRKEDAVERLKFEKINNQICFTTETSLKCLKYIGYEDCR